MKSEKFGEGEFSEKLCEKRGKRIVGKREG